ncbi:hypothetical protein [Archangium lipolyticum]|uniref:hypothetical protein n=1 Tax=Archangium lipolyticum TaxID=2970465 RepID=UPI00214A3871|nr:hypothetical protein [Archangium lipolyticum]
MRHRRGLMPHGKSVARPLCARPRERFREFAPPELIAVEPAEDAEDGASSRLPEHLRLVHPSESSSGPQA